MVVVVVVVVVVAFRLYLSRCTMTRRGFYDERECHNCMAIVGTVHDARHGDVLCSRCGLVFEAHMIDERNECRTFWDDEGEDPSRVGGKKIAADGRPELGRKVLDAGGQDLATAIGSAPGGGGRPSELARIQHKSAPITARQDTLVKDREKMGRVMRGEILRIDQGAPVYELARTLYCMVADKQKIPGAQKGAMQAACLYRAVTSTRVGLDAKTIKNAFGVVDSHAFNQADKKLKAVVDEHDGLSEKDRAELLCPPSKDEPFLRRFASELCVGLNKADEWCVMHLARWIMAELRRTGTLEGRSDDCIAAAAIFVAAGQLCWADQLCDRAAISERVGLKGHTRTFEREYVGTIRACIDKSPAELKAAVEAAKEARAKASKRMRGGLA